MIALSTAWHAQRFSQAKDIIAEIKALGFNHIELNFSLTSAMVEEMVALKKKGEIKVVSIHNFCPIPKGILRKEASPDIFSLSTLDEAERKQALYYTQQTIETASRIGAEVVIIHLGKVQIRERIKELARSYQLKDYSRYNRLKKQMATERRSKSKRFFFQALKSLEQLTDFAQRQKIKLGIENRYYFSEIPSFQEMEMILSKFRGAALYYWHDVGHAQVYENLRFLRHRTILRQFCRRMIGIHLHDIAGIDDHRAPLKGEFDFTMLRPYVKEETLKVLEPHFPATAKEIVKGKKYLEKLLGK